MTDDMKLMDCIWKKAHSLYEEEKVKLENSKLNRKALIELAAQAITRGTVLEVQLHFLLAACGNCGLDKIDDPQEKEVISGAMYTAIQVDSNKVSTVVNKIWAKKRSDISSNAANKLHEANGNKAKHKAIREIWMTGIYSSRDECAELECEGLKMSFSAARKALRNTPNPPA